VFREHEKPRLLAELLTSHGEDEGRRFYEAC
jgi:hypothetical protein